MLSAQLWRIYAARWDEAGHDGRTYLACPVDLRRALRTFPATYFGCAVSLAMAGVRLGELATASLRQLASLTRSAVSAVDSTSVRRGLRALQALRRQEGLSVLESCQVIPPSGLLVTNLSRLPVHEVAFNAGPPVAYDILTPAERGPSSCLPKAVPT